MFVFSIGFLVVPLTTRRSICTWHIWKGMSENAVLKPPNPSPVTERMMYPKFSKHALPCKYIDVVSVFPKLHHRFSFLFGSRKQTAHQLVSSVRSPKYKASAIKLIALGSWVFLGALYWLRIFFKVRLSLWCFSFNSRSVCFSNTYSFQISFSKFVFSLLSFLNLLPHWLHFHVCRLCWNPSFLVLIEPQFWHFLCFFSHDS